MEEKLKVNGIETYICLIMEISILVWFKKIIQKFRPRKSLTDIITGQP